MGATNGGTGGTAPEGGAGAPETITIDEFRRIELITARIVSVDIHPAADRLYVLRVDDGRGGRQVVAGIRADWRPEELVGRTVIVVANLKPAMLRGVESCGMVLAVRGETRVLPLTIEGPAAPGTRVT